MADPQDPFPDLQDGRRVTHWPDDRALLKRAAEVQAQGEKYHEVMGKELHCSPRTLKNRVAKARRRLAKAAEEAARLRVTHGLTVNGLVDMSFDTATAAGWHDRTGELITREHAYFLLAGLTNIKLALARVMEAIRRPAKFNLQDELHALHAQSNILKRFGPAFAAEMIPAVCSELDTPITGSLTEVLGWLNLQDSESAEAMEAAIKRDKEQFAKELADIYIRPSTVVGAINAIPDHPLGPIDPEAAILAKNEINKQRGYRHGRDQHGGSRV